MHDFSGWHLRDERLRHVFRMEALQAMSTRNAGRCAECKPERRDKKHNARYLAQKKGNDVSEVKKAEQKT